MVWIMLQWREQRQRIHNGHSQEHQLSAMMTQHLPLLPIFSGEKTEEETFAEWLEQFEMMAVACRWDEPV